MKVMNGSFYRGVIGLAVGGPSGAVIGAAVMSFISWLRENPEEPAWIFVGTFVGLMLGLLGGSILGFLLGFFTIRVHNSERPLPKSR
jgi:hypothetical protein